MFYVACAGKYEHNSQIKCAQLSNLDANGPFIRIKKPIKTNQTNSLIILILDREMLFCDRDRFRSTNLTLRAGA